MSYKEIKSTRRYQNAKDHQSRAQKHQRWYAHNLSRRTTKTTLRPSLAASCLWNQCCETAQSAFWVTFQAPAACGTGESRFFTAWMCLTDGDRLRFKVFMVLRAQDLWMWHFPPARVGSLACQMLDQPPIRNIWRRVEDSRLSFTSCLCEWSERGWWRLFWLRWDDELWQAPNRSCHCHDGVYTSRWAGDGFNCLNTFLQQYRVPLFCCV